MNDNKNIKDKLFSAGNLTEFTSHNKNINSYKNYTNDIKENAIKEVESLFKPLVDLPKPEFLSSEDNVLFQIEKNQKQEISQLKSLEFKIDRLITELKKIGKKMDK